MLKTYVELTDAQKVKLYDEERFVKVDEGIYSIEDWGVWLLWCN